jgi:hypothetical protein
MFSCFGNEAVRDAAALVALGLFTAMVFTFSTAVGGL